MAFDILIKNALTRASQGNLYKIAIENGKVVQVGTDVDGESEHIIDAGGNLVTESFVNGHLHLCKVYTLRMMDDEAMSAYTDGSMGGAMTSIELAAKVKEKYEETWIAENARDAVKLALKFGNTHIRAFADTDTTGKLEGVKGVMKVRDEFRGKVDIEVVAFPQDGVVRDPGAEEYVEEALKLGADVVGGIPWIEYTDADSQEHIDRMFALAKKYNKPVSMLIDDAGDPTLKSLEMLAVTTIKNGWEGRVTAQHSRAMALYPEPYYRKIQHLLKTAKIGVVSDPQTGPLYARVRDLYKAGVRIALGQDDIEDAYYAFGRNNMLEIAFLAAHLMWMNSRPEMEILYDLITTNAAECLGIEGHVLAVGGNADLVVLNASSVWEAIRNHEAPLHVIKNGVEVTAK
jgi:cytosine deaminase